MEAGYVWTPGGQFNQNVFNNARTVTVAPIDGTGLAVNASVADSLHDYLESRREVNFNVSTINPNYVPINVQWSGIATQGYDPAIVQSAGNAAIYNFINPGTWAGGGNTPAPRHCRSSFTSDRNGSSYLSCNWNNSKSFCNGHIPSWQRSATSCKLSNWICGFKRS